MSFLLCENAHDKYRGQRFMLNLDRVVIAFPHDTDADVTVAKVETGDPDQPLWSEYIAMPFELFAEALGRRSK